MRTEYLYEFALLARLLNYTSAAKELNISQPALSGHIASLEAELGITLIDRSRQQIALTPAGRACLADINAILGDVEVLQNRVRNLKKMRPYSVRIQSYLGHRFIDDVINTAIAELSETNPLMEVEATNILESDTFSFLLEGKVDIVLALDTYPTLPAPLAAEPLAEDPLVAIVPRESPLAQKSSLRMADLDSVECLVPGLPDNHALRDAVCECFESADAHPVITECYFTSIQELYQTGIKGKVAIDSLHATLSLPVTTASKAKILEFSDFNRIFYDVAVYRRDSKNPGIPLLIAELKKLMEG